MFVKRSIRNDSRKAPGGEYSPMNLPLSIEREYQKQIRAIVTRVKDIINENVVVALETIIREVESQRPQQDSINYDETTAEKVAALFASTKIILESQITDFEIQQMVQNMAGTIEGWNKNQIRRVFKQAVGIDFFASEPYLAEEMNLFVINNVNLIKSNNAAFLSQTESVVYDGMRRGLRHEEIAKQILGTSKDELGHTSKFKNAKTRANLIGRDQTNKFNGNLTKLRQENAGVKRYIWRSVGDGRVRERHAGFNGQEFTWEKGAPGGINPGDEIQCRCYAEPVIDDIIN